MPRMAITRFSSPLIVIIVIIVIIPSMDNWLGQVVHFWWSVNRWRVVVLGLSVMRLLLNDWDVKLVDHRSIVRVTTSTKSATTTTAGSSSRASEASTTAIAAVEQNLVF